MFRRAFPVALAFVLALVGTAWAGAPGELSLLAGYTTGDYGTEIDSDTEAFIMRYVSEHALTFRAELPVLRIRPTGALLRTGSGPAPLGRQHQGGGSGSGGPNRGPGGPGGGNGPGLGDDWDTGVGDLRISAARTLAGGGVKLFQLGAGAQVKVPVADEDDGFGTGEWDLRAGLSGEYRFWSVTAFGGAGWSWLGDPSWIELNDVVDAYVGLEGRAFGERAILAGWIDGHDEIVDDSGRSAVVGFELRTLGRSRWRFAVRAGLGDASEDFGLMIGHSFSVGDDSSGYRAMLR